MPNKQTDSFSQFIHAKAGLLIALTLFLSLSTMSLPESLWLDEASTAMVAQQGFKHYLEVFAPTDFHPPLYYLTILSFTSIFRVSDSMVRLPSLIFGLISIIGVYVITKKIHQQAADVAALLLATSPLFLYYSVEARMYLMAAMWVILSVLAFIKDKKILFVACVAAAGLTHYLAWLMLPVYWFVAKDKKRMRLLLLLSVLPIILWSPILLQQLQLGLAQTGSIWGSVLGQASVKNLLLIPTKFIWGRITIQPQWLYGLLTAAIGYILFMISLQARKVKGFPAALVYAWLLLPSLLAAVISIKVPMLSYFRLLFSLPALAILLALGIYGLTAIKGKVIATLAILSLNLYAWQTYVSQPEFQREQWREAIAWVEQHQTSRPLVVFTFPGLPDSWLWYNTGVVQAQALVPGNAVAGDGASPTRRIFYFDYSRDIFDPDAQVLSGLQQQGFQEMGSEQFHGVGRIRILERQEFFAHN